jgi:hypothetical protein
MAINKNNNTGKNLKTGQGAQRLFFGIQFFGIHRIINYRLPITDYQALI